MFIYLLLKIFSYTTSTINCNLDIFPLSLSFFLKDSVNLFLIKSSVASLYPSFKFSNNCLSNNMYNLNKYIEQYDIPCIKKYKDTIKYLLNNENDIIDMINYIIYFYIFLNDLIENNDQYDILKNDEQFIDFCLYQKIKD